jgi:hypothetical protein
MDEGFASLEDFGLDEIADKSRKPIFRWLLRIFFDGKIQERSTQGTHANRFDENRVYNITSYSKGNLLDPIDVFDREEMICEDVEEKYYSDFKFKHPLPK